MLSPCRAVPCGWERPVNAVNAVAGVYACRCSAVCSDVQCAVQWAVMRMRQGNAQQWCASGRAVLQCALMCMGGGYV